MNFSWLLFKNERHRRNRHSIIGILMRDGRRVARYLVQFHRIKALSNEMPVELWISLKFATNQAAFLVFIHLTRSI